MIRSYAPTILACLYLVPQQASAVHPLPNINNTCVYSVATPHRPDPIAPGSGRAETPEAACEVADAFANSNVPTAPVARISPAGGTANYCTIDGSTLADAISVLPTNEPLANELLGATPCVDDALCIERFGAAATCGAFPFDASATGSGWRSLGPRSNIAIQAPEDGSQGAHSIYVRSTTGGHIFYFSSGVYRTHGLTSWPGEPILDITFCRRAESPVVQRYPDADCEGFFCRPIECCGVSFACDGEPDPPTLQSLLDALIDDDGSVDVDLKRFTID